MSCAVTIGYPELHKRLYGQSNYAQQVRYVSLDLTERCNLKCGHCFIRRSASDVEAIQKELTQREWFDILDQMAEAGCLWVLMTGGEIFVRRDFLGIYEHAKRRGFLITLFTNGVAITPAVADYLAEWPPHSIEITVYGRTEKTFERVTGTPGSYRRCMQAIELLMNRGVRLKLKTCVTTENRHEVFDVKEFAGELGLDFRFDAELNMRVDGSRDPEKYRLLPAEVVQLDLGDEERSEGLRAAVNLSHKVPLGEEVFICGSGRGAYHVDAYGNLSGCILDRHHTYDLRKGRLVDGGRHLLSALEAVKRTRDVKCAYCDLFLLCGQCPGFALLESGDPEEPVEYLCQLTRLRAELLR